MQIEIFAIYKYLFSCQVFQWMAKHKEDHLMSTHQTQKKLIMNKQKMCLKVGLFQTIMNSRYIYGNQNEESG